ncbi:PP2C family serine/threonine-protein phosphatase [Mycoplasmoides alvi]|uniref:PP2C family serine/threonine-protein phosphatase n=1 Tax=Mycoplasmoides alvi TaxID=78580 RepID=UPI00069737F5|nr:PP2C family serine/threonine-protein phosphatase [Mycoplasmoides alvi]
MTLKKNRNFSSIKNNSFGSASDVGIVRKENQDSVFIGTNIYNNLIVIVCDGLGGYKGGAIASSIVCNLFRDEFLSNDFNGKSKKFIEDWFAQTVLKSRHSISNYVMNNSYQQPDLSQMATTIVLTLVANKKIYTFWIGDSRAYLVDTNKQTWQITLDHNLYNVLKLANAREETFKKHANELLALTNIISKDIDHKQTFGVSIHEPKESEKYLILCSDGFYNFVNSESFYTLIENYSDDMIGASKHLINVAMQNMSNDNVTVAVVNLLEVLHGKK